MLLTLGCTTLIGRNRAEEAVLPYHSDPAGDRHNYSRGSFGSDYPINSDVGLGPGVWVREFTDVGYHGCGGGLDWR